MSDSDKLKLTTLECLDCGYREVFTEEQFRFTDGLRCHVCDGYVKPALTQKGEMIRNRRLNINNKNMNPPIDVSPIKRQCTHKFIHLDTKNTKEYFVTTGMTLYTRIDYFFCEKCLEEKENRKSETSRTKPEWY
ncbi:hypothetical protein [Mesobacillus stamsii]|uniref:Uncharacterized protein n=1 Tax=Mesobacillus stamsii TaxID=225347 RepID=A0ABU0FY35_9BACI|nr:hypothetical protein [Mesobacillus stamsii]MDQ0414222.1 hypothetical protein [Mesobacillus stamsii]